MPSRRCGISLREIKIFVLSELFMGLPFLECVDHRAVIVGIGSNQAVYHIHDKYIAADGYLFFFKSIQVETEIFRKPFSFAVKEHTEPFSIRDESYFCFVIQLGCIYFQEIFRFREIPGLYILFGKKGALRGNVAISAR